jgi:uncharacterized integral membrane protein
MRNLILLIILGLLAALVVQNLSPSLSLVFLGTRSLPLPLSLWIFLSFLLGVITAFTIARLFQLSHYLTEPEKDQEIEDYPLDNNIPANRKNTSTRIQNPRETVYQSSFTNPQGASPQTIITPPPSPPKTETKTETKTAIKTKVSPVSSSNEEDDDWSEDETNAKSSQIDENWETEEGVTPSTAKTNVNPPLKDYEVKQEPKTQSWSGSSYSFGYRDGQKSGVGKSESVYDADYRVIIPPFRQPPLRENDETSDSLEGNNDEDWGLDLDNDEDKPPHKKP